MEPVDKKASISEVAVEPINGQVDTLQVQSLAAENFSVDAMLDLSEITRAIQKSSAHNIHELNAGFSKLEQILRNKVNLGRDRSPSSNSPKNDSKRHKNDTKNKLNVKNDDFGAEKQQFQEGKKTQAKPIDSKMTNERVSLSEEGKPKLSHLKPQNANERSLEITEIPLHQQPEPARRESNNAKPGNDNASEKPVAREAGISNFSPDDLSQFKKGSDGKLRHSSGRFASKAERKKFEAASTGSKTNNEDARADEKQQTSLLSSVSKSVAKIAAFSAIGSLASPNSSAGTVAGVAMGGSYFLAAQEMMQMMADVKERFAENDINSFADLKAAAKNKVVGAKEKVSGAGSAMVEMVRGTPMIAATATKQASKKASEAKSGLSVIKTRITEPLLALKTKLKPLPSKTDYESLSVLKARNAGAEQEHVETIRALGEIKDAIDMKLTNAGGGRGLLGDVFDAFGDRDKRGRRKGKGRTRGRTGRPSMARGGKFSRMPAGAGAFFGEAGTMAKPGLSAGGGMLKAGGSALRMGGAALSKLALPLTVAMAAFDGVSGYLDHDAQAKAFGLKEGQEATFGQKMSMATGNILSFGGLSELIGISAEDIAQGVYKLGGGEIPSSAKEVMPKQTQAQEAHKTQGTPQEKPVEDPGAADFGANNLESNQPAPGQLGRGRNAPPVLKVIEDESSAKSPENGKLRLQNSSIATSSVTPADMNISPISVPDIEQIVAYSSHQEQMKGKEKRDEAPVVIADPEVAKLLRSIDKKLDKNNSKTTPRGHRAASNPQGPSVPNDFSDTRLRREANDL